MQERMTRRYHKRTRRALAIGHLQAQLQSELAAAERELLRHSIADYALGEPYQQALIAACRTRSDMVARIQSIIEYWKVGENAISS